MKILRIYVFFFVKQATMVTANNSNVIKWLKYSKFNVNLFTLATQFVSLDKESTLYDNEYRIRIIIINNFSVFAYTEKVFHKRTLF